MNLGKSGAFNLHGATRVYGFLLHEDERGKDFILITRREKGRPPLRLDDFAVAYENVKNSLQRPACTIDPRPDVLRNLSEIGRRIVATRDLGAVERGLKEFAQVARSEQDVKVFGIDAETNFAKVMVDADYYLKNVCNGTETIDGVVGLADILLKQAKADIAATGSLSMPMTLRQGISKSRN